MYKFIFLAILVVGVNSRYIVVEDDTPLFYIEEPNSSELYEHPRVRRGVETSVQVNSDGNTQLTGKLPLVGNDKNLISAIGGISPESKSVGLAYDNAKGHGVSLSHTSIPSFGEQITAAGRLNVVNTPDHNLNAKAFVTRNEPKFSEVPNFNTYGGGLDYMYKNKVGASLDVGRTDFLKRTDVSAMGNLNLFKNPTSSLDFSAGAARSFSPHIPNSSWEPKFLFNWSKSW